MKKVFLIAFCSATLIAVAQNKKQEYPTPEYNNEIYYLNKDSGQLVRLEKNLSDMENKVKAAGFGGMEFGYFIDGEKSTTRLSSGSQLSFVFYTGEAKTSNPKSDSVMKANGMDPAMMASYGSSTMDPSQSTTLYQFVVEKGQRKIMIQSGGGMGGLGKKKNSAKYTFSVKKIREGYYELVIDKTLPKGEYAFKMMSMAGGGSGASTLYAFAVQ
jgi:hypothetical protein